VYRCVAVSGIHARTAHGFLFPSYKGRPISIAAPLKLLKEMGRDETIHGMRSAFEDRPEEITFPDWVAKKALAHTIGDETDRAYQRGDLLSPAVDAGMGPLLHTYTKMHKGDRQGCELATLTG
jgi:integrase